MVSRSLAQHCAACALGASSVLGAVSERPALAASLPPHDALTVLIVADSVNPNQLSAPQLTEPEDFAPALEATDSGLNIDEVLTVDSQCVDDALTRLESDDPPDVVLYFAHRAARLCAGGDGQARLVAGLEHGLEAGLGVVVFHHGLYGDLYTPGAKDSLLQLVGAEASGIDWDTTVGQRVFVVGGDHFVATNGLTSQGQAEFGPLGDVTAGTYPYFDNIPDERYPTTELLTEPGETRVPLFATDSGGARLLGYTLERSGWKGRVVAYQPGEYQPNALDARSGNNFQILANALYFAARGEPDPGATAPPISSGELGEPTAPQLTSEQPTLDPASDSGATSQETATASPVPASAPIVSPSPPAPPTSEPSAASTSTPAATTSDESTPHVEAESTTRSAPEAGSQSGCTITHGTRASRVRSKPGDDVGGSVRWAALGLAFGTVWRLRRRRFAGRFSAAITMSRGKQPSDSKDARGKDCQR